MSGKAGKAGLVILAIILFFFGSVTAGFARNAYDLELRSERILLVLPKGWGQGYEVGYTTNPMKVIIDCALPLKDTAEVQKITDIALRQIRYSEHKTGGARLVLDFNYQLPPPVCSETDWFLQIEIPRQFVQTTEKLVTGGVVYGHQRRGDVFGPNIVNYLEISSRPEQAEVKLGLAQERVMGAESVSEIASRSGAIAAVNGAFFTGDGHPVGVFVIDGNLVSAPYANRTALGLGPGLAFMDPVDFNGYFVAVSGDRGTITGLNRPRVQDDLLVYTNHYGPTTRTNGYGLEITVVNEFVTNVQKGNSPIPLGGFVLSGHGSSIKALENIGVGDHLRVVMDLIPDWRKLGVRQIIGGGPRLVRDGEICITGVEENFKADVLLGRAPRTALGITADNKLLLVTVNGRQPNISVGMTLEELACLLLELGAVQAMNLDGGGSTTMVIRDLVLNLPSGGTERPVSNAIVVITPEDGF